jgi:hypothetical protein
MGRWLCSQAVTTAEPIFLNPALQRLDVDAVQRGHGRNGGARASADCHQFGFELGRVGAVVAPHCGADSLGVVEHGVREGFACTQSCVAAAFGSRGVCWAITNSPETTPSGHTFREIVTAWVSNEFQIQRLEEHPHLNREEDYAIYENQAAHLPLGYTLVVQAV